MNSPFVATLNCEASPVRIARRAASVISVTGIGDMENSVEGIKGAGAWNDAHGLVNW